MRKFRNLFAIITLAAVLLAPLLVFAQSTTVSSWSVAANTVTNLVSGNYRVNDLYFYNPSSSNTATLKFYDSATSITNWSRPAFYSQITYETNYWVTYVDPAGITRSNQFKTLYTGSVSNAPATVERTKLAQFAVPPGYRLLLPVDLIVANGFTVLSDAAGTLSATYRPQN